jgi:glucokinase
MICECSSRGETLQSIRQANLLEVNEFLVLDYIRERGRVTRSDVERDIGISRASVSRIVQRLRRDGTVLESPGRSTRGGRPSDILEFNYQRGSVIVADLGGRKCRVALADLSGTIVGDFVRSTLAAGSAYETLRAMVSEAKEEADAKGSAVSCLVVGLPAIIDPDTGMTFGSPWEFGGSDLVRRLSDDVCLPTAVENEANLAALAQAWRGLGRGLRDFAVISIGSGVGGAVVANGQLVKGRHHAAGEIGLLVPSSGALRGPANGPKPTLERALAAGAIAERSMRYLAEAAPGSPLLRQELDAQTVFAAADAGEEWAVAATEETLDLIALAIIAVASVVDPELVILDGGVGRSLGRYVDRIVERVHLRVAFTPAVRVSELGPTSTIIGGVAAGLELARQGWTPTAASHSLDALWSTASINTGE